MRKFFLFFVSLAAMTVISSCRPQYREGSYRAKLYQVDEMFNGEVAQSIAITTTNKPFVENGVTWLQPHVEFLVLQYGSEAAPRHEVHDLPIGDVEAPCNLLWEKDGYSVFECYFSPITPRKRTANGSITLCGWISIKTKLAIYTVLEMMVPPWSYPVSRTARGNGFIGIV